MKSNKAIAKIIEKQLEDKKLELESMKEEIIDDIVQIESKDEILQKLNQFRKDYDPIFQTIEMLEDIMKEFEK